MKNYFGWIPAFAGMTVTVGMTVVAFMLSAGPAAAADPTVGSLLKVAGNSAVYWYGTDGQRHAFPSASVYATWFADFKSVRTVTAGQLAAIPLGATVKYRAGTRLIKLATDPKVYAVEPGGVLRWVTTEPAAVRLYGAGWARRIDDVPDTFFVDYRVGSELDGTTAPNGAVVRGQDGQLYLVGATGRQLLTDAAATFLSTFAVFDSGWLASLTPGTPVATAAVPYGEAAAAVITYPDQPTFAWVASPSNFASPGRDVVLGTLRLTTRQALQIRQLGVQFAALKNASGDVTPDSDFGGLIYGNGVRANFSGLRLLDETGRDVFGSRDLSLNSNDDQLQNVTWSGDWRVAERSQVTLRLVANVNSDIPNNETYQFSFLPAVADVRDASAVKTAFLPTTVLTDDIKAVMGTSLAVSIAAGATKIVRGTPDVTVFSFTLAPGAIDTTLTALTVRSFLHTGSANGFLEGGNVDGGVEVRVRDLVPKVSLYAGTALVAGPVDVDFNGRAAFTGLRQVLKAGTSSELRIIGSFSKTSSVSNASDIVAFDFVDVASQVVATDAAGGSVSVALIARNLVSDQPRQYVQVKDHGSLRGKWQAASNEVIAGAIAEAGTLTFTATDDSYTVNALYFRQVGDLPKSYPAVRLDYTGRNGQALSKRVQFDSTAEVQLTGLGLYVPAGTTVTAKLYAETLPYAAGPVYGESLKLTLVTTGLLQFTSDATGEVRDEKSLGTSTADDFYIEVGQANALTLRFSTFSVLSDPASPTGTVRRDTNVEVMRFAWKADGSGRVRIRKVVFRVSPGDTGHDGRDALEYWASVVGSLDANSVIDLVRVDADGNETTVGEDATTSLRYRVCGGGGGCAEPASGFTSSAGQYAEFAYDFGAGSEFPLSPGERTNFRLKLDTSGFWKADASYKDSLLSLGISLPGYSDLLWTDAPGYNYDARAATLGNLPVTANLQVEKP